MKINLSPRIGSVKFWLALGPAIFLVVQAVAAPFGWTLDTAGLGTVWATIVNSVAALLTLLGVVIDPTTKGLSDSEKAQDYGPLITFGKPDKTAELEAKLAEMQGVINTMQAERVAATDSANTTSTISENETVQQEVKS